MKILVVGGGGVGGYLAAKLSQHFDTTLFSKSLKALYLIENGQKRRYELPITPTAPKERFDLVVFATKSFVLESYAKELSHAVDSDTLIYPVLNGILPYQHLKALFPEAKVLQGAIYIISNKIAPDTIECKGKGAMIVTDHARVKEIFERCGIKVKMSERIELEIWNKYLFIAATAALTAYYRKTFGQIASEHLQEFGELLDEIIRIANEEGIPLSLEHKQRAIELLQKSPPHAKTSLQLDLEKTKRSELANILGYLAPKSERFAYIVSKIASAKRS